MIKEVPPPSKDIKGIHRMNYIPPITFLLSSLFIASCSTAPTSQSMGKNLGTAMILGGLAYAGKDDEKDDEESSSSNKNTGVGIAIAGLAIHYFIGRTETNEKNRRQEIKNREIKKIETINNLKIKQASRYYKEFYKPEDTSLFLKYVSGKKYTLSPHYYTPSGSKITGHTLYIKATIEPPYKQTILRMPLSRKSCKYSIRKKDFNKNAALEQLFNMVNIKREVEVLSIHCENIPQSFINKEVSKLRHIGVKNNSKIMKLAKERKYNFSFERVSDISAIHSLSELIAMGENSPTTITPAPENSIPKTQSKASKKPTKSKKIKLAKKSTGVKNIKVVGKQFGKFNLYKVDCYSGRTDSYYMNSKQEWWKINPLSNFHVGYKGKSINDIAKMRCN